MKLLTPREALRAIADGKKIEFAHIDRLIWCTFNPKASVICIKSVFDEIFVFRLAQEMITIGDVSFPKPESEKPKQYTKYFFPCFTEASLVSFYEWTDYEADYNLLKAGSVHLSEENAIAHAKALIKLSGGKVDD